MTMGDQEGLILVSNEALLLAIAPLVVIAAVSHHLGLAIESPILVGSLRAMVQLSILGAVLAPIFNYGMSRSWVVALYVLLMTTLAAVESSARSAYYFTGMFGGVFLAIAVNTALTCIWAFAVILLPRPIWNPQYVIPIAGMLLGNCINAVALSLNTALVSLVEQASEVEMLLAFGATPEEASSRLFREAIRIGAMPLLNSMAVIGLISIPGMMTGQILGGTPPLEAAKYQMLIVYLIAMCAFGTILTEVWMVKMVGFDNKTHMLRTDRFIPRPTKTTFLGRLRKLVTTVMALGGGATTKQLSVTDSGESTTLMASIDTTESSTSSACPYNRGRLEFLSLRQENQKDGSLQLPTLLEVRGISKSFQSQECHDEESLSSGSCDSRSLPRLLFENLSLKVDAGETVFLCGPSGVGKTQLLRILAWLTAADEGEGDIRLVGTSQTKSSPPALWRQKVRYVSQYKVDIPGTPHQFIERICSLKSWDHHDMPSLHDMTVKTRQLIVEWGLETRCLDSDWKLLSGGEAQRVYLAIAIASLPTVLLLDESTSALDIESKLLVEKTLAQVALDGTTGILWITHDNEQMKRLSRQFLGSQRLVAPIVSSFQ